MNSGDWKYWFNELNKMFDEKDIMHILERFYYHLWDLSIILIMVYLHTIWFCKLNNFIDQVDSS